MKGHDPPPDAVDASKDDDKMDESISKQNSTCRNPDVCFKVSDREYSYISVDVVPDMYLTNATVLQTISAEEIHECQKACLLTESCQSMELDTATEECLVLAENMYSNASLVTKINETTGTYLHLAIKV